MTITLSALQKQRYDTAANWTAENPTLLAGEIGVESDTGKIKIGTGSTAWTSLSYSGLIPGSGVYPYSQLLMPSGTAGAPSISFDGDTNTGIYRTGADGLAISTNSAGRLFVDASGLVGVGTSSPAEILDVRRTGVNPVLSLTRTDAATAGAVLIGAGNTLNFIQSQGSKDLNIQTNSTERLRITSDGKVGLGTSSPITTLDIGGNQRIRTGGKAGSNTYLLLESNDATNSMALSFANSTNANWQIQAVENGISYRPLALNPAGGNVGVGTTSPSVPLEVSGSSAQLRVVDTAVDMRIQPLAAGYVGIFGTESNHDLVLRTNASERMRIDTSGRLLVGTSSLLTPVNSVKQEIGNGNLAITSFQANAFAYQIGFTKSRSTSAIGTIVQSGDELGNIDWWADDGTSTAKQAARIQVFVDGTPGTNDTPGRLVFSTTADGSSSPTERMRITQAGHVLIGQSTTSIPGSGNTTEGSSIQAGGQLFISKTSGPAGTFNRSTSDGSVIDFRREGLVVGSISVTTTATAYNTSSDYRLKENVTAVTDGITRLQQLKPSRFNFIADPTKTVDGFLAHEVQDIVPEAITGEKDVVDDEGNPVYQGIDQSKLVPLLTAALQEAVAKIESLEARLTAAGI